MIGLSGSFPQEYVGLSLLSVVSSEGQSQGTPLCSPQQRQGGPGAHHTPLASSLP